MAALEAYPDGAGRRFELLLHLALNLPQPILVAQPPGETQILHRLLGDIQAFTTPCHLAATPGTSYERILEELRLTALEALSAPTALELTEVLEIYARERRLLTLLVDEADALLPGLLSALCEFANAHASLRVIFALGAEGMARKAATEPMAFREAYALDLAEQASPTPINPLWPRFALGLGGLAAGLMLGAVLALFWQPAELPPPSPPEPTAQQVPETPPPPSHRMDTKPQVSEAPAPESPVLPLGESLDSVPLPSPAAFPALIPEPEIPELPSETEAAVPPPAPPMETVHPAARSETPAEAPSEPAPSLPHPAPAAPTPHHEPTTKPETPVRKLKAGVVKPAEKPAKSSAKKVEATEPTAPLPDANVVIEGVNSVEWLLAQDPDAYVLQVVAVSQLNTLARLVQKFPPDSPLAAMRSRKGRSDLYLLFYGLYPTLAAAKEGAAAIPAAMGRPVPRSLKAIQVDILRTNAQRGTIQAPHAAHFP